MAKKRHKGQFAIVLGKKDDRRNAFAKQENGLNSRTEEKGKTGPQGQEVSFRGIFVKEKTPRGTVT
jgi:hypothetical protein